MKYEKHYNNKGPTPQTEPMAGAEGRQSPNNAGGFAFTVTNWDRLDRFLILGSEGGTYYVGERKLTLDNAKGILECLAEDGPRTVKRIVEISHQGRAPKNDPALFALSIAASAGDHATRQAALYALPHVARIGTHLFHFAAFVNAQRGWGRGLRKAIARWYLEKPVDRLAEQLVKYQQRDGWSHRDMLRLAHPQTKDPARKGLFDWACRGTASSDGAPLHAHVMAYEHIKAHPTVEDTVAAIRNQGLPREAIPTELLNDKLVWAALLEDMPMTAMIRNLGKMTAIELLKPLTPNVAHVVAQLKDEAALKKARLHPLAILLALRTYAQGHGEKGKLRWDPVGQITDALDEAFYLTFQNVEPTNKRLLLACDISGSMGSSIIAGSSLTAREAVAALALVTARTEKNHHIVGFTSGEANEWHAGDRGRYGWAVRGNGISPIDISPRMRLDTVTKHMAALRMGGTDCALPMDYALAKGLEVDAFVVLTDSETWAGRIHPMEALRQYRHTTGIKAKLIVVGMTATEFTIADPMDAGSMDVVGFDAAVPAIMADFIRKD